MSPDMHVQYLGRQTFAYTGQMITTKHFRTNKEAVRDHTHDRNEMRGYNRYNGIYGRKAGMDARVPAIRARSRRYR
jgi:hypothetical protein